MNEKERHEALFSEIVDSAYQVHRIMGPGLLESVYEECMAEELCQRNIKVERQVEISLEYRGKKLSKNYIMDLLVDDRIVVELKSVSEMKPIYGVQLLSYMRLADKHLGALINFNVPTIREGIQRKINGYI